MRGLKDRTVLVTGDANGIGAAIARCLAQESASIGNAGCVSGGLTMHG